jgi:hypothetical protein
LVVTKGKGWADFSNVANDWVLPVIAKKKDCPTVIRWWEAAITATAYTASIEM